MTYSAFHPGEIWKDNNGIHINAHGGGFLKCDGLWHWYGEHKTAGTSGNCANVGVHLYTSSDLYNWADCGIVLDIRGNRIQELPEGCVIERPKVIFCKKTGKFVMWFHFEETNRYRQAMCGVAIADSPVGPFCFVRKLRPDKGVWPLNMESRFADDSTLEKAKQMSMSLPGSECEESKNLNFVGLGYREGQESRDMSLFLDDDAKAYLIYSSEVNSTLHISELTEDYTNCAGRWTRIFVERWMESPCIFKHSGKYYFIGSGCTGWAPNAARSAVAESIWGPWTELGNPAVGSDSELTFHSQSTFVLTLSEGNNIYIGDRWTPENAIDGRYVWLPIEFDNERPIICAADSWRF